jgi:hypothetical protein
MTGAESSFNHNYDSPTNFTDERTEVVPRISKAIGAKNAIITIFFAGN